MQTETFNASHRCETTLVTKKGDELTSAMKAESVGITCLLGERFHATLLKEILLLLS